MCTGKEQYGRDNPRPINRYLSGEGKRGEGKHPLL
jgi:hypothetical protein